jgi:D-3-phosphoglycerate dehydrogenase
MTITNTERRTEAQNGDGKTAFRVLVCDPIADDGVAALREAGLDVDVRTGLAPKDLKATVGGYDALVVRSETKITKEIIEAAGKLQVVGRAGIGVDNIDLDAATEKGVVVVNAPTGNVISAAEHALALMPRCRGTSQRRTPRCVPESGSAGGFRASRCEARRSASSASARLGRRSPAVRKGSRCGSSRTTRLWRKSARVSVSRWSAGDADQTVGLHHRAYNPHGGTKRLIGTAELRAMKPSARVINTARGGIIDETALKKALTKAGSRAPLSTFSSRNRSPNTRCSSRTKSS